MSVVRPLPLRPSLEYERKEAKALLRRLRAGDSESIARAQAVHPRMQPPSLGRVQLADAQLVIAREYGFASWPKLVQYFNDVHRQTQSPGRRHFRPLDFLSESALRLVAAHQRREPTVARELAAYVPRFYGLKAAEIFASSLTEDDARLTVARRNGYPSWEVLRDEVAAGDPFDRHKTDVDPARYVSKAMAAADLPALISIVDAHPELLHMTDYEIAKGRGLLRSAISFERRIGRDAMRPIIEWLESQGLRLQDELNRQLCGHIYMRTEKVGWLLDRGADPNWVAPNGVSVLDHAIIRYWNGEAVDLLAARVRPRKALWISAGLGDVDGVARFLDRSGKPTPAARRDRPYFDALQPGGFSSHPDPDDEEILMEAFLVAMFNSRVELLEYMVSRGAPIDSLVFGSPAISLAVGNAWVPVVECLIRLGADLDLDGVGQRTLGSARKMAREHFLNRPEHEPYRQIVELCGLVPDGMLAERAATPPKEPEFDPRLEEWLRHAGDDAFRLNQPEIGPENLLFALLRFGMTDMFLRQMSLSDLERFYTDWGNRIQPGEDLVEHPKIPIGADLQHVIQQATTDVKERRRGWVDAVELLYALLQNEEGPAAKLLARYGGNAASRRTELAKWL
jgi:hypothetical protein